MLSTYPCFRAVSSFFMQLCSHFCGPDAGKEPRLGGEPQISRGSDLGLGSGHPFVKPPFIETTRALC